MKDTLFKKAYPNYINLAVEVYSYPEIANVKFGNSTVDRKRIKVTFKGGYLFLQFDDKELWKIAKKAKPGNYFNVEGQLLISTNFKTWTSFVAINVTKIISLEPGENKYMSKQNQKRRRLLNQK
ncbi:hypothetical protein [Spiroplasma endosymbiont of Aspidapion aeneum]|uniref:hypothetical protein n=1 Tax=Spiroplasma endosymbiont of Aspidapion aeneum TaxID=3066276 RepID=UPI00313CC59E